MNYEVHPLSRPQCIMKKSAIFIKICNSKKRTLSHVIFCSLLSGGLRNLWSELVEITSASSFHGAQAFISPPVNKMMCTSSWGRAKVFEVYGIKHLEDIQEFYWRHLVSSKQDIHEENWILEITGPKCKSEFMKIHGLHLCIKVFWCEKTVMVY